MVGELDHFGPSNPLCKTVAVSVGARFSNYRLLPWTTLAPALGLLGSLLTVALLAGCKPIRAFWASAVATGGIIATAGFAMFPLILPSSSEPKRSVTVWDSSSSQMTLFIMLIAVVIFPPIVLAYTAWVYRVLRGKVTAQMLE